MLINFLVQTLQCPKSMYYFFANQNMKKLPSKAEVEEMFPDCPKSQNGIHIEIWPKRYLFTCSVVKTINFKLVILKRIHNNKLEPNT